MYTVHTKDQRIVPQSTPASSLYSNYYEALAIITYQVYLPWVCVYASMICSTT